MLRTGDLRHVLRESEGEGHVCRLFRHSDVETLVDRAGGVLLDSSTSNWASLPHAETLASVEADPDLWARFLDHKIAACAEPGPAQVADPIERLAHARPNGWKRGWWWAPG